MSSLKQIDPTKLAVSPLNERQGALGPDHDVGAMKRLEQSVQRVGVLEPPIVREHDLSECDGDKEDVRVTHEVIIGQRRMYAAQHVGLDEIPVIVVDWNDADSLEASIVENIDAFKDKVGKKDRAIAVYHLKQMNGWTQSDVADHLNVSKMTVSNWFEYFKEEWEGTIIHGENNGNESKNVFTFGLSDEDVNKIPTTVVSTIRPRMRGSKEGMKACAIVVQEELSAQDVRDARDVFDDNSSMFITDALKQVAEQKHHDNIDNASSNGSDTDESDDDAVVSDSVDDDDETDSDPSDDEPVDSDDDGGTNSDESQFDASPEESTESSESPSNSDPSDDADSDRHDDESDETDDERITIRKMSFDEPTSQTLSEVTDNPEEFVIQAVLEKIDRLEQ